MITITKSFTTSDNIIHATIEAARKHELAITLEGCMRDADNCEAIAESIINNSEKVIDCLTMKATSHPRARKANGAKRKPKTANENPPTQ